LQQLLGARVRVREAECGQLQLLPNDEVAFCCANTADSEGPALEARLIDLIHTSRAAGSLLGCFSLTLPQPPSTCTMEYSTEQKELVDVQLPGYALTDRVLLSEVPLDLGSAGLMRFFKKLGGTEASIVASNSDTGLGFASIFFSGPESIAKFLVQATHTISETGITQLAHVSSCPHRKSSGCCPICSDSSTASVVSDVASEASMDSMVNDLAFGSTQLHQTPCGHSLQNLNGPTLCADSQSMSMQSFTQWTCCPSTGPCPGAAQANPPQQVPLAVNFSSAPSWRCVHCNIVVPAVAPEVVPLGENGCSVRIQWPTVIHASAYVVELLDQGTMASQQYIHVSPEGLLPAVMDVQVDGLRPSVYGACVRCVAPCGCESTSSPWSILRVGWVQPAPASTTSPALHALLPNMPTGVPSVGLLACPPPPTAPPSLPLTVTTSAATTTLPPIPEETCDIVGSCSHDILTLD